MGHGDEEQVALGGAEGGVVDGSGREGTGGGGGAGEEGVGVLLYHATEGGGRCKVLVIIISRSHVRVRCTGDWSGWWWCAPWDEGLVTSHPTMPPKQTPHQLSKGLGYSQKTPGS